MRCHKCDEGVLQIAALTPPDEGWAVGCNKCDYSTWKPPADWWTAKTKADESNLTFECTYKENEE